MKAVVISGFYDKQDKLEGAKLGHHYVVDDIYPREGVEPTEERTTELVDGGFLKVEKEPKAPKKTKKST